MLKEVSTKNQDRILRGVNFPTHVARAIERFAEQDQRTFSNAVVRLCRRALESEQQEAEPVQAR